MIAVALFFWLDKNSQKIYIVFYSSCYLNGVKDKQNLILVSQLKPDGGIVPQGERITITIIFNRSLF